jgi:isopentenyldiphosphate isomerase
MLKTQLQLLNQQLQTLMERRNRRKKRRTTQSVTMPSSPQPPKAKKKKVIRKRDPEEMIPEEITYEQKRELSDNINILPPDKLPQVFEIIKENAQLNVLI